MPDPTPSGGQDGGQAGVSGPDWLDGRDLASVTPEEFAALVKKMSNSEITETMRGELRTRVLTEIFARMERLFRPEAAGSLAALIRWEITGARGSDEPTAVWETRIADGACTARQGASEERPRTTLTMSDAVFLKLVSGNANPITLFMTRKLKVGGDIGLASGLTRLFDIPRA